MRQCLHQAARMVKHRIATKEQSLPPDRAHYLVRLWRDVRAGRWDLIKQWANGIHFIQDHVDMEQHKAIDFAALASEIRSFSEQMSKKDLEELEGDNVKVNKVSTCEARRAGLIRQIASWRSSNPRVMLAHIIGPEGPCVSAAEICFCSSALLVQLLLGQAD